MTREQRQVEILRIKTTIGANEHRITTTQEPLTKMGLEIANQNLKVDLARIEKQQ